MAKFNSFLQALFFLLCAIFLIMASMAPPSLSRTLPSTSSMDLNHTNRTHVPDSTTATTYSRSGVEFEVDAHEVPSGPNPISNK
ncbi:hypothetical protein L6452_38025 [Arctium lappa]|uniref:Uncharacterized protein n=1 Tax=Arctium lappa TaxID=4217 RepID=A0ACB8Y4L8_ARCLA|nr:hypothetical protein L6452_38025 [Arctium lappa]